MVPVTEQTYGNSPKIKMVGLRHYLGAEMCPPSKSDAMCVYFCVWKDHELGDNCGHLVGCRTRLHHTGSSVISKSETVCVVVVHVNFAFTK